MSDFGGHFEKNVSGVSDFLPEDKSAPKEKLDKETFNIWNEQ